MSKVNFIEAIYDIHYNYYRISPIWNSKFPKGFYIIKKHNAHPLSKFNKFFYLKQESQYVSFPSDNKYMNSVNGLVNKKLFVNFEKANILKMNSVSSCLMSNNIELTSDNTMVLFNQDQITLESGEFIEHSRFDSFVKYSEFIEDEGNSSYKKFCKKLSLGTKIRHDLEADIITNRHLNSLDLEFRNI